MPLVKITNLSAREFVIGNPDGNNQAIELRPNVEITVDITQSRYNALLPHLYKLKDQGRIAFVNISDTKTTTETKTMYVDGTAGSDGNTGSSDAPFKTINRALDTVPQFFNHTINIRIRPGTYTEGLGISKTSLGQNPYLMILGDSLSRVTLTTGSATGTITSQSGSICTVAGATWTVDNLRNKFVRITAHATPSLVGKVYAIAANTADTFEIPGTTTLTGGTFEIVEPNVIIDAQVYTAIFRTYLGNVFFGSLKFTKPVMVSGTAAYFGSCTFNNATLNILDLGVRVDVSSCILSCTGTSYYSLMGLQASRVSVYDTVFDGNNIASQAIALDGPSRCQLDNVIIQNVKGSSGTGITTTSGGGRGMESIIDSTSKFTVRNCGTGIIVSGNSLIKVNQAVITGNTSHGIVMGSTSFGGHCHLNATSRITVTGNGGDGIRCIGAHNSIMLSTNSIISGNTGYGVNLAPTRASAHNDLWVAGNGLTMGTNTAGDIMVDGTTAMTIAALQADADKTVSDPVRFNRASIT